MAPPLVERPEAVDDAWLTDALHASGALDPDAAVVGFTTEPVGTGQMGDSVRFRLEYSGPAGDAPASVVGKFAAADDRSRATGIAMRTYEVEVRFYQELAATLDVRAPRCHHADVEPVTGTFVLLMEDLAPAEQGDQMAGCDPDRAAAALAELARLHAPRWGDPALEELEWLHRTTDQSVQVGSMLLPGLWPGFVDRYADRLDADALALGERLLARIGDYLAHRPRPWTVQHGDFRLDNLLFRTGEEGHSVVVVDWQTVVLGPGGVDASYFLGAGLLPEVRRAHERELLAEYHGRLVAAGVGGYDLETCFADYRRHAFAGFLMAVGASMMVEQTARGDDMFVAMASRHARQALDLESEALLGVV